MNRKIRYRGFSESLNKWIVGVPYFSEGNWWILVDELNKSEDIGTGSYLVDTYSIGHYTDLEDKNNKEICSGDILKVLVAYTEYDGSEYKRPSEVYNHKTKYVNIVVSFESGTFILDTNYTDSLNHTLWLWTQEEVEIIGNIYENKELLEDEKS